MKAIHIMLAGLLAAGPSAAGWQPVLGLETTAPVYPEVAPVLPDIRPGNMGVFAGLLHPWGRGVLGYDPIGGVWMSIRVMRPHGGLRPFVGLDRTYLRDGAGEGTRFLQAPWSWKLPVYAGTRVDPHPRWGFSLGAGRGDYALELQQRPITLRPVGGFAALHVRVGSAWITFEAREPSHERTLWIRWSPGGTGLTQVTLRARYLDYTPDAVTADHVRLQIERVLPVKPSQTLPPELQELMDPFHPVAMGWEVLPLDRLRALQKSRYIEISAITTRTESVAPSSPRTEPSRATSAKPNAQHYPRDPARILLDMARADLRAGWVARARTLMRMARRLTRASSSRTDLLARP